MQKPCFRVRYSEEALNALNASYNVEKTEVNGAFISVFLIPITKQFIQTKQLSVSYIKKQILKP